MEMRFQVGGNPRFRLEFGGEMPQPVPPGPVIGWDETKINVMTLDENEEPTDTIVHFMTFDEVCDYMMSDNQKYWVHQGNQMNPIPSLSRWQFDGYDQLVFIDLYGQTEIPDSCFSGYYGTSIRRITGLDGVVTIGETAFYCQSRMEPFNFPSSLRNIGSSAFELCELFTDIVIPEGVTILPSNVFYGCSGLISITLPSTLTEIEGDAFWRCRALESITIPGSVTAIGDYAFLECDSLTTITIDKPAWSLTGAPWGAEQVNVIWTG